MPVEVMKTFEQAFDCIILEGYGLSETSPVASFNHPDRERKPGSIGTPIEGVEMKVVDDDGGDVEQGGVGEIVIRGHNVMKGYWSRADATADVMRDGWFATGDMATVDEDGYFFIVDRKKDMIIRGGYNVYPREIEEVLYEHPAVSEVAVVGVPDDSLGEEVAAAVVLQDGRGGIRGRHPRVRQGACRRLQVPAQDLVPGRAAQGPDGQDPQARDQGPGVRRAVMRQLCSSGSRCRYAEHLTVRARTFSLAQSGWRRCCSSPRPSAWAQDERTPSPKELWEAYPLEPARRRRPRRRVRAATRPRGRRAADAGARRAVAPRGRRTTAGMPPARRADRRSPRRSRVRRAGAGARRRVAAGAERAATRRAPRRDAPPAASG